MTHSQRPSRIPDLIALLIIVGVLLFVLFGCATARKQKHQEATSTAQASVRVTEVSAATHRDTMAQQLRRDSAGRIVETQINWNSITEESYDTAGRILHRKTTRQGTGQQRQQESATATSDSKTAGNYSDTSGHRQLQAATASSMHHESNAATWRSRFLTPGMIIPLLLLLVLIIAIWRRLKSKAQIFKV